jgi:hypothetical protein
VLSLLLGAMGTIAGGLMAVAARAERGRLPRMMLAPALAVVPFMVFTPWLYMLTQGGNTPLTAWFVANYQALWVATGAGVVWSAAVGLVASFGLWMTERPR